MKRLGVLLLAVIFFAAFNQTAQASSLSDGFYVYNGDDWTKAIEPYVYGSGFGTIIIAEDEYQLVGWVTEVESGVGGGRITMLRWFNLTAGGTFKILSPAADPGRLDEGDIWEIELTLAENFQEVSGETISIGSGGFEIETANKFIADVTGTATFRASGPWNPPVRAVHEVTYPVTIPISGEIAYGEYYSIGRRELEPEHRIGYYRLEGTSAAGIGLLAMGGFIDFSGTDWAVDFAHLSAGEPGRQIETDYHYVHNPPFFFNIGRDTFTLNLTGGDTIADYIIGAMPLVELEDDPIETQIGTYDTTQMRIGTWDPVAQAYIEYPFQEDFHPIPGFAVWMLFRNDTSLTFQGYPTPVPNGGFDLKIHQGWNMVGNPFNFPVAVDDIIVYDDDTGDDAFLTGTTCGGRPSECNEITDPIFWVWEAGEYLELTGTLEPGRGGWVYKSSPGEGAICFPAEDATVRGLQPGYIRSDSERKPPSPPRGLEPPFSADGGGGGCFIKALGDK